MSTQKSFSKIVERKLLKPKINDENKDSSNFLEVTNSKISTVKFQKTSTNNKSAIPTHLKIKENLQNDKGFQELMKAYNDPKMKTKTLPDYFDIECLKDFDLSLEKIDKKANMNNLCIKSIGDFTIIKQKMETNDHNMPLNLKNEINIQNLEKFFNKKNDKKQELGSPTNNLRKFEERVKVNSNYEKEKKKITVNQPPIRNNWIAAPYKSHSALRECQ